MINKILSQDTIAAPITPVGGSVCLIRISGNGALSILKKIFVGAVEFKTHTVYYGKIIDKTDIIDEVLVTVMIAPKSFTMEDVVEIGCHGGSTSVTAVLSVVLKYGARLAEPGEFTKRAFLNGRIDLAQAEAVADLIEAKSAAARRGALNRMSGGLSQKVNSMANELLLLLARIEAAIDYPEHEDEIGTDNSVIELLCGLTNEMKQLIGTYTTGRIVKDGINAVIIGKPNVGKSSLLNALLDDERAIVTNIPGTTRDLLKEHMLIGDIPVNLVDTAGMRETDDTIENIGIARAIKESKNADLVFVVVDDVTEPIMGQTAQGEGSYATKLFNRIAVINKIDVLSEKQINKIRLCLNEHGFNDDDVVEVSAKKMIGIDTLRLKITQMFMAGTVDYEAAVISSARHKETLDSAFKHLENALETARSGLSDDFISIDLTAAYRCLGEITGESLSEDIIDKIFSEFCLGK